MVYCMETSRFKLIGDLARGKNVSLQKVLVGKI